MAKRQKTGGRRRGTPNKTTAEIKAAFQKHGTELVMALLALTRSDDERVRLGAIQACLDRGWGKPAQALQLQGDPDSPVIFNLRLGDGAAPKVIEHQESPEVGLLPALAAISAPDEAE